MAHMLAGLAWLVLLLAAAFFVGRESRTPRSARDVTAADVSDALQLITDEGLITAEDRETLWRTYVTRVRAA